MKNPRRRKAAGASLRVFCEKYFPERFFLGWSPDHLEALDRLEQCVREGGQFAYAMPRGSGKTTLAECAALWAVLYGYRRFVVIVGATKDLAVDTLAAIKTEIEVNDLLDADFPEVCQLVRALEGINNRANGQLLNGERTRIEWTDSQVVLPTVKVKGKGKPSSGAVIRVYGLTGAIRGAKFVGADGKSIRPDLVILDDPQTDDSAKSPAQNNDREKVITRAVLGLAGPKKKIAAIMPCTIICPGDMVDRMTDPERHPSWHGKRSRMVLAWPERMDLWDQYAEIRREELRREPEQEGKRTADQATAFYLERREEMDRGAVVSWPERFDDDEVSAIQNAMNLRIDRGIAAFNAEFQNDPQPEESVAVSRQIDPDAVVKKLTGLSAGVVPRECTRLTAMIDVGKRVLWYTVCAWDERYGGSVIEYGAWPRQNRAYFSQVDARPAIHDLPELKNLAEEARIFAALKSLTGELLPRSFPRDVTGEPLTIERCLVDSGDWTDTIHKFCRSSPHAAVLTPSKGHGIKAEQVPMSDWPRRQGERRGRDWVMRQGTGGGYGRTVVFDANSWKSFVAERLATPEGAAGCLWLHADGPGGHQMFADHLSAESAVQKAGRGRVIDLWSKKPGREDNHWWDCLVGCAVAAQVQGLVWDAQAAAAGQAPRPRKRQVISASEEIAAREREERA